MTTGEEIYEWYRQLIGLRHAKRGRTKPAVNVDPKAGSLRFFDDDVACVCNFSGGSQRLRMPRGEWALALRSDMNEAKSDMNEAKPEDEVPAQATFIFTRRG